MAVIHARTGQIKFNKVPDARAWLQKLINNINDTNPHCHNEILMKIGGVLGQVTVVSHTGNGCDARIS